MDSLTPLRERIFLGRLDVKNTVFCRKGIKTCDTLVTNTLILVALNIAHCEPCTYTVVQYFIRNAIIEKYINKIIYIKIKS
jgi:hypothetical protein